MTVEELIEILEQEDPDLEIVVKPSIEYRHPAPELDVLRKEKGRFFAVLYVSFDATGTGVDRLETDKKKQVVIL